MKSLDNSQLKKLAMITMLIDHMGAILLERTTLYSIKWIPVLDFLLRMIGRLAFPIFCFLLVQGFIHTSNLKRYIRRLLIFALCSEIPFDLAVFSKLSGEHQNVGFTLLIGILMLSAFSWFEKNTKKPELGYLISTIIAGSAAYLLAVDYSYQGILLIAILYLLRNNNKLKCILGGLLFTYQSAAVFAFPIIYNASGKKGNSRISGRQFYLFYPIHLLILYFFKIMILTF